MHQQVYVELVLCILFHEMNMLSPDFGRTRPPQLMGVGTARVTEKWREPYGRQGRAS